MRLELNRFTRKRDESSRNLSIAGIVLLIAYFGAAVLVTPGSMSIAKDLSDVFDCQKINQQNLPRDLVVEGQSCPSVTEQVVNLESINFDEASFLKGTLRVWPAGEIGSALVNTGVAQRALTLNFDSLNETSWEIPAKRFIGSRTFEIPLNNSSAISSYPFDSYQGSWSSFLLDFQTSKSLASTLTVSKKPIYGWEMAVSPIAVENDVSLGKTVNLNGKLSFAWTANRSDSIKLSAVLLIVVMILGTVAALILSTSIFRGRRPPTLSALGWLATSLFAILEIRNKFPGDPPLGIAADLFVTYPVTLTLLGLILANTYFWLNRDDWDMKNRPDEHSNF